MDPEQLCQRRFNEVTYATTHNAMSDASYRGWLFPEQNGSISRQLGDGIRGIMLESTTAFPAVACTPTPTSVHPVCASSSSASLAPGLCQRRPPAALHRPTGGQGKQDVPRHGFCELGALSLDTALGQIRDFLEKNPHEALTIVFEDYVKPSDLAAALEKDGVAKHAFRGQPGAPWPTLREMVDNDQRVLLLLEHNKPSVPWMHRAYDVMQETPFHFTKPSQLKSASSCKPNRGDTGKSIFLMNHWIDTAPLPLPTNAGTVNGRKFLLDRVKRCEKERGVRANLLAVDFYRTGNLMDAVDTLNGTR